MTLRGKLIRLAHAHPEHRARLLPLLKEGGRSDRQDLAGALRDLSRVLPILISDAEHDEVSDQELAQNVRSTVALRMKIVEIALRRLS